EWADPHNPDPLPMPLHGVLIAEAKQRIDRGAYTPGSGSEKLVNYFVGQIVGSLNQERTCRQVVMDMVEEYIAVAQSTAASLEAAGA
ncbi:MAG: nitronate monooxygenase, partial [Acidimicrobiia bacterium]